MDVCWEGPHIDHDRMGQISDGEKCHRLQRCSKASRGRNSRCSSSTQKISSLSKFSPHNTRPERSEDMLFFFVVVFLSHCNSPTLKSTRTHARTQPDSAINITSTQLQYWQHRDIMIQAVTKKTMNTIEKPNAVYSLGSFYGNASNQIFSVWNVT